MLSGLLAASASAAAKIQQHSKVRVITLELFIAFETIKVK